MKEYRTAARQASDEFTEKKSRFIGSVKPVSNQAEAVAFINEIRTKYWDATHNVYAYVLRDGQIRRYSDDGEPQGTAGIPVLDVLLKEDVTDCAVVVTRYFGGIMLGAGGLVRAYSHASKMALDAGGILTMAPCTVCETQCDYNFYGKLSSLLQSAGACVIDSAFTENVKVMFSLETEKTDSFEALLTDSSKGGVFLEKLYEEYKNTR